MAKRNRDASNDKGQEDEKEDEEGEKEDGNEEKEEEEEEADAQEENLEVKVASMSCPRIWIKVRTEEGQVEISVAQNDSVNQQCSRFRCMLTSQSINVPLSSRLLPRTEVRKCMLGDDVDVTQGTFQEHSIGDRSTIHAGLIIRIQTRDLVQNLVDEIIEYNPDVDGGRLMNGATFDEHGNLQDW